MKKTLSLFICMLMLLNITSCKDITGEFSKLDETNESHENESIGDTVSESEENSESSESESINDTVSESEENSELSEIESISDTVSESEENSETEVPTFDKSLYHIETYFEDGVDTYGLVYQADLLLSKQTDKFNGKNYVDDQALPTITVDFLGKTYTAEYEYTTVKPRSNFVRDKYVIKESEEYNKPTFYVRKDNRKVASYLDVPITNIPTEESDFLELIQIQVGEEYNLSDYIYSCYTSYGISYDGGYRHTVEEKFKKAELNEEITGYSFGFKKKVNGIIIDQGISASFNIDDEGNGKMTLQIVDYGYDDSMYYPIFDYLPEIESGIDACVRADLEEGVVINDVTIRHDSIFIMNGKPHMRSTAIVYADIPNWSDGEIYLFFTSEIAENTDS